MSKRFDLQSRLAAAAVRAAGDFDTFVRVHAAMKDLSAFAERLERIAAEQKLGRIVHVSGLADLSKEAQEKLKTSLTKRFDMPVHLVASESHRPGLALRSVDWHYDESVHGRLRRLSQALVS